MSFPSQYATKLWDILYSVYIPDQVTLSPEYVKRFGVHVTGDKGVDKMLSNNFTNVKIPVMKILDYYDSGVEIQIPSREDMIQIHKDIEGYLLEWKEHLRVSINVSVNQNKEMLLALEKLSKRIYEKAQPKEVIDNLFLHKTIGLVNPLANQIEQSKVVEKPNYEGISKLVRSKVTKPVGRF